MRTSLALVLCLAVSPVAAQSGDLWLRAPVHRARGGTTVAYHHALATAFDDGSLVAALHFDGSIEVGDRYASDRGLGGSVVLARFDADGRIAWMRAFADEERSTAHLRRVTAVRALSDGSVLVSGQHGESGAQTGVLARFDRNGELVWMLRPLEQASGYAELHGVEADDGGVIVRGLFRRGNYQLPGGPRWTSSRPWSSFLARVEASGAVAWAQSSPTEVITHEVRDGAIVVVGTFRGTLHGRRAVGGDDVYVARYDASGRLLDTRTWGTAGDDRAEAAHALAAGPALLVRTERGSTSASALVHLGAGGAIVTAVPDAARMVRAEDRERAWIALPHDRELVSVDGEEQHGAHRVRLVAYDATGRSREAFDAAVPGVVLGRTLDATRVGDRLLLSGVFAAPHRAVAERSEAFVARITLTPAWNEVLPDRADRPLGPLERTAVRCECEVARGRVRLDAHGRATGWALQCASAPERSTCLANEVPYSAYLPALASRGPGWLDVEARGAPSLRLMRTAYR